MSTLAGAEGVRAGGSAVKHAMFILVSLVTVESHVARHLVELEAFMPMLFSLLDSGVLPLRASAYRRAANLWSKLNM